MDQSEEADFEIEIFTAEEITRILAAVRDDARPALAIGAFAGIRMAEVCRLDWAEVSLEKGLIEIKKGKAKTRSRRLVPITENLALFLKDVAHRNGPVWPNSEPFLFDLMRDSNFNAAALVQRSFNVSGIPQAITFGPLSQQGVDAPFPLGATASSGLPVSFTIVSGPATLGGSAFAPALLSRIPMTA